MAAASFQYDCNKTTKQEAVRRFMLGVL